MFVISIGGFLALKMTYGLATPQGTTDRKPWEFHFNLDDVVSSVDVSAR